MWGVGLCCRITSAPDLPKEQVGTWLQPFPRSERGGAVQGRVGGPAEYWLPTWHVLRGWADGPHRTACSCL